MAAFRGVGNPYSYEKYGVGKKHYGGGRDFPTMGPVDPLGYKERDAGVKARRNAMLRRMQMGQKKKYLSSDWLRGSR